MDARRAAFVLSLAVIFSIPWESTIRLPGGTTVASLIGFVLAAVWMFAVVVSNRLRLPHGFQLVFYAFVLWNAVSALWTDDIDVTLGQVMTWAQLLVFAYILWDLYKTRASILLGLQAYILGAYVAVGGAIVNFFAGNAFYNPYQRFSPGSDVNPDGFGFIVALGIPIAWYLGATMRDVRFNVPLRLINYTYIPVAFLGMSLAGTRTALIAAIPAMAFGLFSLVRLNLRTRVTTFLLLVVAILVLLPYVQPLRSFQRFGTTYDELTQGDFNQRIPIWLDGIDAFLDAPLLGVGGGTYRSINQFGKVAHNSYVSILAELGLVGFALFAGAVSIAFLQARRLPKFESRFWTTLLLVLAIGSFALTWEDRKSTWLFLSLMVASANAPLPVIDRERLRQYLPALGQQRVEDDVERLVPADPTIAD